MEKDAIFEAADELAVVTICDIVGFPLSLHWCTTHSFVLFRTIIHESNTHTVVPPLPNLSPTPQGKLHAVLSHASIQASHSTSSSIKTNPYESGMLISSLRTKHAIFPSTKILFPNPSDLLLFSSTPHSTTQQLPSQTLYPPPSHPIATNHPQPIFLASTTCTRPLNPSHLSYNPSVLKATFLKQLPLRWEMISPQEVRLRCRPFRH